MRRAANTSSYQATLAATAALSRGSTSELCLRSRMAKPPAAEVDAGGRAVRVSSPERVIYEATDRTLR